MSAILALAVAILQLPASGLAISIPLGGGSGSSLQQSGSGGSLNNTAGFNVTGSNDMTNYAVAPVFGPDAHVYFVSSSEGQIVETRLQ